MKQKYTKDYIKRTFPNPEQSDFVFFWSGNVTKKLSKSCLSQWYPAVFTIDGVTYSCAEQYMMAEKARISNDMDSLKQILETDDPRVMKRLGRGVKNFAAIRWALVKFETVVKGNIAKFGQNEELKQFLLGTGDAILVEASPYDKVWGIGMYGGKNALNVDDWKGENLLGFALMQVRDEMRG